MVQYVNKVGKKFYAGKKILPFLLNPPQIEMMLLPNQTLIFHVMITGHCQGHLSEGSRSLSTVVSYSDTVAIFHLRCCHLPFFSFSDEL